jgi:hypothetical protein
VDVFGEDLVTRKTYQIHFTKLYVGLDDQPVTNEVRIYPNPAKNTMFINGAEGAGIKIFNIAGQLVMSLNDFRGKSIDISALNNGVYTVQLVTEDNTVINHKVTIVR